MPRAWGSNINQSKIFTQVSDLDKLQFVELTKINTKFYIYCASRFILNMNYHECP